jgi:hypothetical protein
MATAGALSGVGILSTNGLVILPGKLRFKLECLCFANKHIQGLPVTPNLLAYNGNGA